MSEDLLPLLQTFQERHVQIQGWHEIQIRGRHDREFPPYPGGDDDGSFGDEEDDTTMLLHHPKLLLHPHSVENPEDAIPKYSH